MVICPAERQPDGIVQRGDVLICGHRDAGADAGRVDELGIEAQHGAPGSQRPTPAEDEPRRRAERDDRATPARRILRIRVALDQAIGLGPGEHVADHMGDTTLVRRAPVGTAPAPLSRLMGGLHQPIMSHGGFRVEHVDDDPGHHRLKRVAGTQLRRQLIEQRQRVAGECSRLGGREQLLAAAAQEPLPDKPLAQLPEHEHVRLSMWWSEQVRVPPVRPALSGLTHHRPRQSVGLGERNAAVAAQLEQPARRGRRRSRESLRARLLLVSHLGGAHGWTVPHAAAGNGPRDASGAHFRGSR